jgi:hypothetical protein
MKDKTSASVQPPPHTKTQSSSNLQDEDHTTPTHNSIVADDNPILRLHHYIREIYTLFSFIVSFNYTAAGTTLFRWMYQLYQLHFQQQHNRDPLQPQSELSDMVHEESGFSEITSSIRDHLNVAADSSVGISTKNTTPNRPCRDTETDEKKDDIFNTELDRQLYTIPQSPLHNTNHSLEQTETISTARADLNIKTAATTNAVPSEPSSKSQGTTLIMDEKSRLAIPEAAHLSVRIEPKSASLPSQQTPERGQMQRYASDNYQYFDTVTSNESLRQMSIDIPVPDKFGYVLGDEFLMDPLHCTPLLVFVNSRSGPQQGIY